MPVLVHLADPDLEAPDLQRLTVDLCRTINSETDVTAELPEETAAPGQKGDPVTIGQKERALEQYQMAETSLVSLFNRSWNVNHDVEDQDEVNLNLVRLLGVVYERIGAILDDENDLEGALEVLKKSMEYRKFLVEMNPLMTDAIRDEAIAHEKLGDVYRKKAQLDEAWRQYQISFEIFRWLADADTHNIQAKQSLAISHIQLGDISFHPHLPSFNDREAARTHYTRSQQLLDALIAADPGNAEIKRLLGIIDNRMQNMAIGP